MKYLTFLTFVFFNMNILYSQNHKYVIQPSLTLNLEKPNIQFDQWEHKYSFGYGFSVNFFYHIDTIFYFGISSGLKYNNQENIYVYYPEGPLNFKRTGYMYKIPIVASINIINREKGLKPFFKLGVGYNRTTINIDSKNYNRSGIVDSRTFGDDARYIFTVNSSGGVVYNITTNISSSILLHFDYERWKKEKYKYEVTGFSSGWLSNPGLKIIDMKLKMLYVSFGVNYNI